MTMSKAHALLGLLAEGGNTGFWTYGPNTRTVFADAACCKLLACSPAVSSLAELVAGIHADERVGILADIEGAIARRSNVYREFRLQGGGEAGGLSLRGRWSGATDAAQGEFICVVERNLRSAQHEKVIVHRYEQLRSVLENSPVVLYEQDAQLRYEWVLAPRVGLQPDAITGKVSGDFLEPASALALDNTKRAVMDSGKPLRKRLQVVPKGHAGGYFDVYMAPRFGPDGQINGVISVAIDMAEASEQEQRMLAIFERAPVAITLSRQSDGVFLKANDTFLDLMGYTRDEVIGSSTSALRLWNPPQDRERMLAELQATGHVRNMIGGYRKKSGKTGRLLVSVESFETGGERLMLGMMTDISDLEEARHSLALSEARYRLLSEASFEGIGLARDGIVVDANEQIAKILGVAREDLIGKPVTRNMKPTDVSHAMRALERGGDSSNEYEYLRPDGSRVVVEVRSKDLFHAGEKLRISALRDVTEKKQKELALHNLQLRFSHMMESNVVGIFIAGPQGEIFESNDYFLNMLGLDRQALEAGQLNWQTLTAPETLGISMQSVEQMMHSGGSLPYEKEYLHADGHRVPALVALSQLSADPVRGIVIVLNISDLKATQSELQISNARLLERTETAERAEAAKTLFLSSISHELRTPLHTVLGHVRLLRKNATGDELNQLRVVEHSSTQLLRLIDDLLEFNHTAIAPEQLVPEPVVMEGFVANLESIGNAAASSTGNAFYIQLGEDLPSAIVVDEGRLVQVLRILIDNACKYTRAGVVIFTIANQADTAHAPSPTRCWLRFSVEDNGRGMDPQDTARIFEPLLRGSNASDKPGLGLGLAIAEQWITRMGSHISLQTTRGVGSCFSFVLDLDACVEAMPLKQQLLQGMQFSVQTPSSSVAFMPLPDGELSVMAGLIDMGRVGRLRDWARALEMRYPEHAQAARYVEELARNAELDALEKLHRHWVAVSGQEISEQTQGGN